MQEDDDASHAGCCVNELRTVGPCGGSEVKSDINTVQFLAQTNRFMSLDLNVLSRAAGLYLVLSVYVFFFSQSCEYHWLALYDWQTATVWVKKKSLFVFYWRNKVIHLGYPWGKQINVKILFWVNYPFKRQSHIFRHCGRGMTSRMRYDITLCGAFLTNNNKSKM